MKIDKFLEIDTEMDRVLTELCDAALKKEGMRLYAIVNQLISSIQQKEVE